MSIDFSVLIFTFAVALGAGLFIGLAPAFSGTRLELMSVVKNPRSERVSRRRPSLRDLLVVTEIALSLILLVGAGLLIRSFWQLTHVESGLKPEGLLTASVALPEVQYQDNDRRAIFFSDLVKTIQQIPHITLASATTVLPFTGSHTTSVEIVSRDHEELKGVERRHVTPGFFETAEIPLLKGRTFSSSDDSASPLVMVVNQWFARRVFPGQNPIGQRIAWQGRSGRHLLEIVGVVGDIKDMGLDQDPRPTIYIHIRQTHAPSEMRLLVRTQGLPESAISDVRQVLRKFDPTLPLHQIATMQQVMSNTVSSQQFSTILLSLFAVIALLLAVVGIYGVMSHIVGLRRYEIGIRIAIGSKPEQIVRLIVRQGMVTAFVGISLGTALAFAAAHVLQGHLFEIEASDPRTFFGVTVLISFISLVACYLPARRAARIDPAQTLRLE
ncbi:MAG: FtsX-like permease family protein [bacterium]|nr:FtsX-like permease family protein [bacterium]